MLASALTLAIAAAPSGYIGGVWNPEDMVRLPGTSWAVVSAMRDKAHPGALRLVDLAHPARPATALPVPGVAKFSPHGLGVRAIGPFRAVLFVVEHGGGEAVDRFTFDTGSRGHGRPRIVDHVRIALPARAAGNGVAPLDDGGFVVAGAVDPSDKSTLARFARAQATGHVWRWSPTAGWRPLGPPMSGANGIAVSADGRFIYASEWAAKRIWRMRLDGHGARFARVSFLPDNLRWNGNRLLVAGQFGRPERIYACAMPGTCRPMGYAVAAIDRHTLRPTLLLRVADATARRASFGGVSGAVRTGQTLWLTSFMGRRLAYRR